MSDDKNMLEDYKDALVQVSKMRLAQKQYYQAKPMSPDKQKLLVQAKQLESLVDMQLAELGIRPY